MRRGLLVLALTVFVVVAGPAHPAAAAMSCSITTQTTPTGSGTTHVSWTWAVSCTGVTGQYNVLTSVTNTTKGKSYGKTGTGSPFATATAGATETKTIPACNSTDLWNDKVAVRTTSGKLLAGPTTSPSVTICAPPPPSGPTVPADVTPTVAGDTEIDLSWSPSGDQAGTIQGYDVYRDGTRVAQVTSGTTFADTGLDPGTTHTYQVDAYDGTRTSALSPPVTATTTGDSGGSFQPITHVIVLFDENRTQAQVTDPASAMYMPFLTSLGNTYAHTTSYTAIQHPSLPNYFAVTSGSTQGVSNDCGTNTTTCATGADNIFHQLEVSGGTWQEWAESEPTNCATANSGAYVVHHAIPPFYTDLATCATQDFPIDVNAIPPISAGYTFITPNNNDNAHGTAGTAGDPIVADNWLKTLMGQLMAQPAYTDGSTLVILSWDEGVSTNQTVNTVLVNPRFAGITLTGAYNHYSTLRLSEELLHLPLLGAAATANDMMAELGLR
jgi:hypothetical protein